LDWNLPKKGRNEVFRKLKEDNNLKNIPVIILITSSAEKEILKA
jgi:CheY-like chemotaxis protein